MWYHDDDDDDSRIVWLCGMKWNEIKGNETDIIVQIVVGSLFLLPYKHSNGDGVACKCAQCENTKQRIKPPHSRMNQKRTFKKIKRINHIKHGEAAVVSLMKNDCSIYLGSRILCVWNIVLFCMMLFHWNSVNL